VYDLRSVMRLLGKLLDAALDMIANAQKMPVSVHRMMPERTNERCIVQSLVRSEPKA
jgi:hypothetical protein